MNKNEILEKIQAVEAKYDELEEINGTNPDTIEMTRLIGEMDVLYKNLALAI